MIRMRKALRGSHRHCQCPQDTSGWRRTCRGPGQTGAAPRWEWVQDARDVGVEVRRPSQAKGPGDQRSPQQLCRAQAVQWGGTGVARKCLHGHISAQAGSPGQWLAPCGQAGRQDPGAWPQMTPGHTRSRGFRTEGRGQGAPWTATGWPERLPSLGHFSKGT